MKIKAMIRDNIAMNAHPKGIEQNIQQQIQEVSNTPLISPKKLNVLIIGGSSGYGLASRIALAFNANAYTYNVSFEREARGRNTASAGYYNNLFFKKFADQEGIESFDRNGDAFSHQMKNDVIQDFKNNNKKIDLLIYSVASGVRIDPDTQEKYVSSLKPIGKPFTGFNVDIAKGTLSSASIDPASDEEIENTRKVMGGEDYLLWVQALSDAQVFNEGAKTITYTYIGSKITYPIYKDGTIGHAKRDLERCNETIQNIMSKHKGEALISSSKTVVTKASVFIPTVALYGSCLFKVMKELKTHETITQHKLRLFTDMVYGSKRLLDDKGLFRLDAYELDEKTQDLVNGLMSTVKTSSDLDNIDFEAFKHEFNAMSGFDIEGVDYDEDLDLTQYESK